MKKLSVFSVLLLFLLTVMSSLSSAGITEGEPYTSQTVDCSKLKSDYEIHANGKTKKLSVVLDWSMQSENVPVTVYLIDENDHCRVVLNSWGSGVDFDDNSTSSYPDIEVSCHMSAEDNPSTLYKWNGHEYENLEMAKSKKLNNQALQLFKKGQIKKAIAVWKHATDLSIIPGLGYTANAEVLNNLGFAYYKLGENYYSDAEEYLTEALQVDPQRWIIYLNLGDLYSNMGRYNMAIENYKRLLELKSDYEYAYEIKKKIELLKTKSNYSRKSSNINPPHLLRAAWPEFHQNNSRTGLSPYDTNSDTGVLKWSYATRNLIFSSPAIGPDGTIYVGSNDHNLYAINPNGALKWSYTTSGVIASSPAIGADGMIYVWSADGNVYAISPKGTMKWKYKSGGGGSSPAIGADGTIYVGLYALTPTGTVKWSYTISDDVGVMSSPAIGADGTIYVGCIAGSMAEGHIGYLYAISPNGALKWSYTTGDWVVSIPAVSTDGTIYFGSLDGNFYAINPDGTLKWSYTTKWPIWSSPSIAKDGTIYFGADNGKVYALKPTGRLKWSYSAGSYVKSSPAISADGTIYVGSGNGELYAINPNGKLKWSYRTGWLIEDSSPAIGVDGTIYVGSLDGKLYAIH